MALSRVDMQSREEEGRREGTERKQEKEHGGLVGDSIQIEWPSQTPTSSGYYC